MDAEKSRSRRFSFGVKNPAAARSSVVLSTANAPEADAQPAPKDGEKTRSRRFSFGLKNSAPSPANDAEGDGQQGSGEKRRSRKFSFGMKNPFNKSESASASPAPAVNPHALLPPGAARPAIPSRAGSQGTTDAAFSSSNTTTTTSSLATTPPPAADSPVSSIKPPSPPPPSSPLALGLSRSANNSSASLAAKMNPFKRKPPPSISDEPFVIVPTLNKGKGKLTLEISDAEKERLERMTAPPNLPDSRPQTPSDNTIPVRSFGPGKRGSFFADGDDADKEEKIDERNNRVSRFLNDYAANNELGLAIPSPSLRGMPLAPPSMTDSADNSIAATDSTGHSDGTARYEIGVMNDKLKDGSYEFGDFTLNRCKSTLVGMDQTTEMHHAAHRHWMDPMDREDRPPGYQPIDRRDRVTRATALSMITDLMLNEDLQPSEAVDFLEDLENACKTDGVSLSELLGEDMSIGGVPPLMWEIQRCNWREEPELLMFLVIRTPRAKVPWMIRTACQAIGDNALLQRLRETLEPDILCDVMPSSSESEFNVAITIKDFAQKLRPKETSWTTEGKKGDVKKTHVEASSVTIEWIVEERAWALELKADALELTLLDGPPATVSARLHVDPSDTLELALLDDNVYGGPQAGRSVQGSSAHSRDMEFPSGTVLLPISRAGRNSLISKPAWRPETWGNDLHDARIPVSFQLKVSLNQILEAPNRPIEEEKVTTGSPDEDDDWVIEYDDGKPAVAEEDSSGWVLASWSGKDKDLDGPDEEPLTK
ncbi:hypothetical protein FRC01_011030 [Tulasnella sp. 417]|nr:hypothetical protein FRC01_011030 [Tulasnella sp. 417]